MDALPSETIAEKLAEKQREISVAEFFERNKQILGFDSPTRALLTGIKEAVDNALDACEEASILPDIQVELKQGGSDNEFIMIVEDNGPGIVRKNLGNVFASLLYGSRFHAVRQSLHPDERILVERYGRTELVPIGAFADAFLRPGQEDAEVRGIRVPAFNHEGKYSMQPVSHVIRHRRGTDVVRVRLKGGSSIRVTDCHSLFTLDADSVAPREVAARDLRPGDLLLVPRNLPAGDSISRINLLDGLQAEDVGPGVFVYGLSTDFIDQVFATAKPAPDSPTRHRWLHVDGPNESTVRVFEDSWKQVWRRQGFLPLRLVLRLGLEQAVAHGRLRTYHHGNPVETPVTIDVSRDLGHVLGWYVAEGHADRRQLGFTLGAHESERAAELEAALQRLGMRTSRRKHGPSAIRIRAFGSLWPVLLPRWCGSGAHQKQVPTFLFQAPPDARSAFLQSLYQGDGHVWPERNQATLTTVSQRLAEDTSFLWRAQGVLAKVRSTAQVNAFSGKPSVTWYVTVYGRDVEHLGRARLGARRKSAGWDLLPADLVRPGRPGHMGSDRRRALPDGMERALRAIHGLAVAHEATLRELGVHGLSVNRLQELHFVENAADGSLALSKEGLGLVERVKSVDRLLNSDLAFVEVASVERLDDQPEFVYDLSVPGCENFVGGSSPIACHNSRGQQGIGISATVLYGQLTTGKHAVVTSKIGKGHPAVKVELAIDTKKNAPEKIKEETVTWEKEHGTRVEICLVGRYIKGKQSPFEYLRATAIVNPHARLSFVEPDGTTTVFERVHDEVPPPAKEIKPHPLGTEIGTLLRMARAYEGHKLNAFLQNEFSSVGARAVSEILKTSGLKETVHPRKMSRDEAKALIDAFPKVKIMAPPTDCLSPIGDVLVKRGLKKETVDVSPEFIVSTTRPASVSSGHPFIIEAGIVYGGTLNKEEPVKVLRYANRVPLLYQQGACALTHALEDMDWRRYGFDQRGGKGVPVGPAIVLVHIAATKVPFTSESKEAVADVEEILKEVKLALQECARTLGRHLAKRTKREKTREKFTLITKILPKIAEKSSHIVGKPRPKLDKVLCEIMNVVWIDDSVEEEKMAGPKTAPVPKPAKAPKAAAGATTLSDFTAQELAALNAEGTPKLNVERYNAKAKVTIWNYMLKKQHFRLVAVIPPHAVVAETSVKPKTVKDRYVEFDIPAIAPAQKYELAFTLAGLEKGDYDENELYVTGINEVYVVGADPWRGAEGVLQPEETAPAQEA